MSRKIAPIRESPDNLLPHNLDAERSVLGSILMDGSTIAKAAAILETGDFYRDAHGKVFSAMKGMSERSTAIDDITLKEELTQLGDLEKVGGAAYIAALADGVPTSQHIEYYARIVKEKAILRTVIAGGTELVSEAWSSNGAGPADVVNSFGKLGEAVAALRDVGEPRSKSERLVPLRSADHRPDEPIPVDFGTADGEVLVNAGDLILLAGEVGAGKSLVLLDLCIARSLGQSCLGFQCGGPGKAVFLTNDGEGPRPVLLRASRLLAGRGSTDTALDTDGLRLFTPERFCLDTEADFADLARLLSDSDPDFLALDSLNALMGSGRDRKDDGSIGDFMRRLRRLQRRPNGSRRTLLVACHLRKLQAERGSNRLKDRLSGSYYLLGGADACIGLDAGGVESFVARAVKRSRWGTTFEPFLGRFDGKPGEPLRVTSLGHLQASQAELGEDENRVLETMTALQAAAPKDGWVRLAEVKLRLGIKREDKRHAKALERAAARLEKAGRLEEHPNTRRTYRLPREKPEGNTQEGLFDPQEG